MAPASGEASVWGKSCTSWRYRSVCPSQRLIPSRDDALTQPHHDAYVGLVGTQAGLQRLKLFAAELLAQGFRHPSGNAGGHSVGELFGPFQLSPLTTRGEFQYSPPHFAVVNSGTTDTLAHVLAPKLGQRVGKPFVIENRPGDAIKAYSKTEPRTCDRACLFAPVRKSWRLKDQQ
jgi:hypothetical protein